MTQFNWKTDGEDTWNEGDWPTGHGPTAGQRRWLRLLLFVLVIGLAAAFVYHRLGERVDQATTAVTNELLSSYSLMWFAFGQSDSELFDTLLSGREPDWTEAQRQLFAQQITFDRAFWGLALNDVDSREIRHLVEEGGSEPIQFSPDLLEAEILTSLPYLTTTSAGLTETVTLQQSSIFRRGEERWLLAPPGDAYWGLRVRQEGSWLTLDYPRRDAEIAGRLGYELDDLLGQMCQMLADLNCPPDLRVTVRLDTEPDQLLAAAEPAGAYAGGLRLVWPTVTLLGVPVDEAGFQALYRAYARQLAAAAVAHLVDWECCAKLRFFEALLAYQQNQLGLRPWPIESQDHVQLIEEGSRMNELALMWLSNDQAEMGQEASRQAFLLMDFLLGAYPERTAAEMQRQLAARRTFGQWLDFLYADLLESESGTRAADALAVIWRQRAYQQAIESQPPLPLPLPAEQIQLACYRPNNFEMTRFYRYQPDTALWTEVATVPGLTIAMYNLPGEQGTMTTWVDENGRWQSAIWQDQVNQSLFSFESSLLSVGQVDPTGRYVVAYTAESALAQAVITDMAACDLNGCQEWTVPGPVVWSPDGAHTLISDSQSLGLATLVVNQVAWWFQERSNAQGWRLYRGDGRAQSPDPLQPDPLYLGMGSSPFWLDETTYGYVRDDLVRAYFPSQELVIASVADDRPQVILTSNALREGLADEGSAPDWLILAVMANPMDASQLFLFLATTAAEPEGRSQVVSLDRQTGQLEPRFELGRSGGGSLGFSPNGRWLVVTNRGNGQLTNGIGPGTLFLHDIEQNRTETLAYSPAGFPTSPIYAWSADDSWLSLIVEDNILALVAPEPQQRRYLAHDLGACVAVAWMAP